MLPVIEAFMTAYQLPDVTVVADAGMISEANQRAIEAAGLSFIFGARIPAFPTSAPSGATSIPARTSRRAGIHPAVACRPSGGRDPGSSAGAIASRINHSIRIQQEFHALR